MASIEILDRTTMIEKLYAGLVVDPERDRDHRDRHAPRSPGHERCDHADEA